MGYFLVCWVGIYAFNVAPRPKKYKGISYRTNTLNLNNYTKGTLLLDIPTFLFAYYNM